MHPLFIRPDKQFFYSNAEVFQKLKDLKFIASPLGVLLARSIYATCILNKASLELLNDAVVVYIMVNLIQS